MPRKMISLDEPIYNKLKRMGFAGQSFNNLIEDLIDFAKKNIDLFNEFLDERYEDDEE
jgi:predicted CopG family antitoxin